MRKKEDFLKFESRFYCNAWLKVSPCHQFAITDALKNILKEAIKLENGLISAYNGPFFVFGQHDITYSFSCDEPAKTSRLFYAILDTIECKYPGAIRDFFKTICYKWELNNGKRGNDPCLGYATFKYFDPGDRKKFDKLYAKYLIDEVTSIKSKLNLDISCESYGTLGWHELIVYFYGKNYANLQILSNNLETTDVITHRSLVYLWDDNVKNLPNFSDDTVISMQLGGANVISKPELIYLLVKHNAKPMYFFDALNYVVVSFKPKSVNNFKTLWEDLLRIPSLHYSNSTIFSIDHCDYEPQKPVLLIEMQKINVEINDVKENLHKIKSSSLPVRKLMGLRTEIEILRKTPQFSSILPRNLKDALDLLMTNGKEQKREISNETIQHYISEITHASRERLSGTQLDAIVGKDIGFLEDHGSYQRLSFACESLITRCFEIYIKLIAKFEDDVWPLIFTFFDYGARLSSEIPPEMVSQGLKNNMPIIIRLRMVRYKPWLWVIGLREISKMLYFIKNGIPFTDVLADDPDVVRFSDIFIRNFYSRENTIKIIAEEIGYFSKQDNDKYVIDYSKEEELATRCDHIDIDNDYYCDYCLGDDGVFKMKQQLERGYFFFEMDYINYINFINAYQSLDRETQISSRPLISYTLSLFWDYWRKDTWHG